MMRIATIEHFWQTDEVKKLIQGHTVSGRRPPYLPDSSVRIQGNI